MKGFFAYAAKPPQIAETIRLAIEDVERFHAVTSIVDWSELDIAGRFIATEVLREIDQSDFLVADITSLNFNVTYEVGYAIGRGKRVRSEEHTSELQSLMRNSYAVFCLQKKTSTYK